MEPHAFVKEVYRRMSLRHAASQPPISWPEMEKQSQVLQAVQELRHLLPQNKNAAILDIGFGHGWFLAACLKLGYQELSGADFGIAHKDYIRTWSERPIQLYEIEDNIVETSCPIEPGSTTSSTSPMSSSTYRSTRCCGWWTRSTAR